MNKIIASLLVVTLMLGGCIIATAAAYDWNWSCNVAHCVKVIK